MYTRRMPVHVLLLDPNRARRDAYRWALHKDIVVQAFGDATEVSQVSVLDMAIVALRQTTSHGLEIGKELKAKFPRATVVVYGKIEGQATSGKVNERWRIDTHMPFLPEPADIAALVESARLAEQRVIAAEAAKNRPSVPPTPRPEQAWRELLTEPVTQETLKTMLKKDVFSGWRRPTTSVG